MAANDTEPRPGGLREVPLAIWALGFVSLLMDVSSEIIHALLPIYQVSGLGASMVTVGLIEGVGMVRAPGASPDGGQAASQEVIVAA